jgi:hypothetical protein
MTVDMVTLSSPFLWFFSAFPLWPSGIPCLVESPLKMFDRFDWLDRSLPVQRIRCFSDVVHDGSLPRSELVCPAAVSEAAIYRSLRRLLSPGRGSQACCRVDAGAIFAYCVEADSVA